jgi:ferrous iron transport protein A
MTLDELQVGQSGSILDITGDDGIAIRLMEMGLTEGEQITLIGFAPLGDPIEFLIRSYRLSLRKAEAKRVTVSVNSSIRTSS